jgi:hypothetical protein
VKQEKVTIESDFWVGIVEDNSSDPLRLGRCRVRIIGLHSFDATELPTEGLPWAMPTLSLNGTKGFSVPNINDWLFGYFLDGKVQQQPVIIGVLPGLINVKTFVKLTGEQQREYIQKLAAQAQPDDEVEEPPQPGQPTTPAIARGQVANTSIQTTNDLKTHACDIRPYIDMKVASAKQFVKLIVSTIRKGIVAALRAIGISPGASALGSFLNDVRRALKSINNFLTKIVGAIADVVEAVRRIRAIIDYILNLPERLRRFFVDCLNQLIATLQVAAFEIVVGGAIEGASEVPIDIGSLQDEVSGILNETQDILNNASQIYAGPFQIASALVTPSGQELSDEEVKEIFEKSFSGYSNFNQQNYLPVSP